MIICQKFPRIATLQRQMEYARYLAKYRHLQYEYYMHNNQGLNSKIKSPGKAYPPKTPSTINLHEICPTEDHRWLKMDIFTQLFLQRLYEEDCERKSDTEIEFLNARALG